MPFTTFVLFQFFNVFKRQCFANGKLWMALSGVVGLQLMVVPEETRKLAARYCSKKGS